MRFRYSVVRYVPSLLRGERLNLGIVIESEDGMLQAKFLSSVSRIRSVYPDANFELIRLARDALLQAMPGEKQQLVLVPATNSLTLDEMVRDNQGILSFEVPAVTLGSDIRCELESLYQQFVAPTTAIAPKPIAFTTIAPRAHRERLDAWLSRHSFMGPRRYTRAVQLQGTVSTWAFDYGFENGSITAIQALSVSGPTDAIMDRAALLAARVQDVREAHADKLRSVIAVTDASEVPDLPFRYLEHRRIEAIPLDATAELELRLSKPLPLARSA